MSCEHRSRARAPLSERSAEAVMRTIRSSDGVGAQFVRFLLVGGTANLAYVGAFLLLSGLGSQVANGAGAVVSAAIANELHRRLTFHARTAVGWRTAQWQGGL